MIKRTVVALMLVGVMISALPADENSAVQLLESLRDQMKELRTLRASYVTDTLARDSNIPLEYTTTYLKKDDFYNIQDILRVGDSPDTRESRVVYDGNSVKTFSHDDSKERQDSGTISEGNQHRMYGGRYDLLRNASLGLADPRYDQYREKCRFEDLGTGTIEGRSCRKVVQISPFLGGKEDHWVFWIEEDGSRYRLMRVQALIDGNPDDLLGEYNYRYQDLTGYPFPSEIHVIRYNTDPEGNRTRRIEYTTVVEKIEINGEVADSEFDFRFPNGTHVFDTVVNTSYVVGGSEGPEQGLRDLLFSEENDIETAGEADEFVGNAARERETAEQPGERVAEAGGSLTEAGGRLADETREREIPWPWIVLAVLVLSAVSVIVSIRTRRRRREARSVR